MTRALVASGFHAPVRGEVQGFEDAVIVLDDGGTILSMTECLWMTEGGTVPQGGPPGCRRTMSCCRASSTGKTHISVGIAQAVIRD